MATISAPPPRDHEGHKRVPSRIDRALDRFQQDGSLGEKRDEFRALERLTPPLGAPLEGDEQEPTYQHQDKRHKGLGFHAHLPVDGRPGINFVLTGAGVNREIIHLYPLSSTP